MSGERGTIVLVCNREGREEVADIALGFLGGAL
jgi:hypothetical protein